MVSDMRVMRSGRRSAYDPIIASLSTEPTLVMLITTARVRGFSADRAIQAIVSQGEQ
jgi:hypothetical protein